MKRLKVAVVGAGHLGRIHARLLAAMPDAELIGVADPLATARDKTAADCQCAAFADHRALLSLAEAVIIATPTREHHQVAIDFLRHGTSVLVEKPLAANLAQAEEMVQTAERQGAILQVGHIERFNPAFLAAAPHVTHPRYVEAVRASGFTGRSTDIGVVYDLMIHDIDLVLSMTGAAVQSVSAIGLALLGKHEDVAQARVEFDDGCVANLSASRVSFSTAPRRQMHVWSEQAFATIDFGGRQAQIVHPNEAVAHRQFDYEALSSDDKATFSSRLFSEILRVEPLSIESRNALADELRDFCDSVRARRAPRVTGHQGRDAVALAERILESIQQHRWHRRADGPVGPQAMPLPTILRPPHWPSAPETQPRREAG